MSKTNTKPRIPFKTPSGIAERSHIASPDTEGEYADNKYKVKLRITDRKAALQAIAEAEAAAEELHGTTEGIALPIYEDEDGTFVVMAKTQYQPTVYDAEGDELDHDAAGRGSTVRLGGALEAYTKTEGKGAQKKTTRGLTYRLWQVMVLESKRSGGGGGFMFAEDSSGSDEAPKRTARKATPSEDTDEALDI